MARKLPQAEGACQRSAVSAFPLYFNACSPRALSGRESPPVADLEPRAVSTSSQATYVVEPRGTNLPVIVEESSAALSLNEEPSTSATQEGPACAAGERRRPRASFGWLLRPLGLLGSRRVLQLLAGALVGAGAVAVRAEVQAREAGRRHRREVQELQEELARVTSLGVNVALSVTTTSTFNNRSRLVKRNLNGTLRAAEELLTYVGY